MHTASPAAPIHVAAAVVRGEDQRVLVQCRPDHLDHGGLWEFPGGKIEPGESVADALVRELDEELGIRVRPGALRIRVPWDYGHRRVVLHVLDVNEWTGRPIGREGQAVDWLTPEAMAERAWPAANWPIIRSLQLPDRYLITPVEPADADAWLARLDAALARGVRLVQLRRPDLDVEAWVRLGRALRRRCDAHGAWLLANGPAEQARAVGADGVHWSSRVLAEGPQRPGWARWVGASCHNGDELERAAACGADFALLSPVQWTASHPEQSGMGWERFAAWVAGARLPVYALGGVGPADIHRARACGGQGVAAIRGLLAEAGRR
ncbi:Nudix family hydrolase [Halorhodospira halophila]|uniref:8-oxo-dGTP diphosphatase n=1 Tax=Halorhodospira halophila (strain DSM 244 / SL1) TaxID=349124 RepID=A1WYM7_HALHL|nr:Nudix family hydrolase [Halorhodospira halophila]ABM62789.1 8-oxo-dGTPase [Halorhodospira halophila SL1]